MVEAKIAQGRHKFGVKDVLSFTGIHSFNAYSCYESQPMSKYTLDEAHKE